MEFVHFNTSCSALINHRCVAITSSVEYLLSGQPRQARASSSGVAKATALFVRHLAPLDHWRCLRQHGRSSQKTAYQIYCGVPTHKAAKRRQKKRHLGPHLILSTGSIKSMGICGMAFFCLCFWPALTPQMLVAKHFLLLSPSPAVRVSISR